jgi:hypothetical protein
MKVIVEKREIVGTLKTLLGTYTLLGLRYSANNGFSHFDAVDDEGFSSLITVHGDFVVIPAQLIALVDVKRVLTEEEAQGVEILDTVSID